MSGEATYSATDRRMMTGDFLPMPRAALHEVGPATQTLGAVIYMTDHGKTRTTFASQRKIADWALLSESNVKRHLTTLTDHDYLINKGRAKIPGSSYRLMRTMTYTLSEKCIACRRSYNVLPRWAAYFFTCSFGGWKERCLYAALVSRHMMIEEINAREHGEAYERDVMGLQELVRLTGLDKKSVIAAKLRLKERGLILVETGVCYSDADRIQINPDFRVPADFLPSPPLASGKMTECPGGKTDHSDEGGGGKMDPTPVEKCTGPRWKNALGVVEKCTPSLTTPFIIEPTNKNGPNKNTTAVADGACLDLSCRSFPEGEARVIFDRLQRYGVITDGKPEAKDLSRISALVAAGLLPESFVWSAAQGTKLSACEKPLPYFMTCLRESTAKAGIDLRELERTKLRPDSQKVECERAATAERCDQELAESRG